MTTTASMTQRETDEQWAIRLTLADYRRERRSLNPFAAARYMVDATARVAANNALDGALTLPLALLHYATSKAVYEEVCRRAGIPSIGRTYADLTRTERYWQTGELAEATS